MSAKHKRRKQQRAVPKAPPSRLKRPQTLGRYCWWAIIALILLTSAARFIALEQSPPGFYVDEAAGAANIISLSRTGASADGTRWPLFANALGGGYSTPVYLYFGALWTRVFGYSVASFRSIAAFFSVLTILGIYCLARSLFGHRPGLLSALAAALSPWCFNFSRIAWDPPLAPCFLVWGLFFFVRSSAVKDSILSGFMLALAMYSYPPLRAQVPLLVPALLWFRWRYLGVNRVALGAFCFSGLAIACPLIIRTFSGEFQGRYKALSIFNPEFLNRIGAHSTLSIAGVFIENLRAHLSPAFLLLSGDANLRHNSQFCGELGWFDVFSLGTGIVLLIVNWLQSRGEEEPIGKVPVKPALLLWLWGLVAGFIPAALTWENLPHALRSIGAWPFVSLFCGLILWRAIARWRTLVPVSLLVALGFAVSYGMDYFTRFKTAAAMFFDAPVMELAREASKTGNWKEFNSLDGRYPEMALRYYRLVYRRGGGTPQGR